MADTNDAPVSLVSIEAIRQRYELLAPHVQVTPSIRVDSDRLSPLLGGAPLWLKLELFQRTGTFKARGALSRVLAIPADKQHLGITAASAGNHAIAAAWAARHVGVSAKVVMMDSANPFRVERARMLGAEVVIIKGGAEAMAEAARLEQDEGRVFVHPFEGPFTSLGAAGVGLEFIEQVPDLEAVVVAVGGGGLISGVAAAIKQINPACKVYGVEPEGADSMHRSLAAGRPMAIEAIRTLADSLGAPSAMPFSFSLCQQYLDDLVRVNDDQICAGVVVFQEECKLAVEPAAGAAMAAVFGPLRERLIGKRTGIVVCGANIDAASYLGVMERGRSQVAELLGD